MAALAGDREFQPFLSPGAAVLAWDAEGARLLWASPSAASLSAYLGACRGRRRSGPGAIARLGPRACAQPGRQAGAAPFRSQPPDAAADLRLPPCHAAVRRRGAGDGDRRPATGARACRPGQLRCRRGGRRDHPAGGRRRGRRAGPEGGAGAARVAAAWDRPLPLAYGCVRPLHRALGRARGGCRPCRRGDRRPHLGRGCDGTGPRSGRGRVEGARRRQDLERRDRSLAGGRHRSRGCGRSRRIAGFRPQPRLSRFPRFRLVPHRRRSRAAARARAGAGRRDGADTASHRNP